MTRVRPLGHPMAYDPEQAHDVAWSVPGVERVVGLRFADAFGTFALMREPGRAETIDGRACVVGGFLAIDIGGAHRRKSRCMRFLNPPEFEIVGGHARLVLQQRCERSKERRKKVRN